MHLRACSLRELSSHLKRHLAEMVQGRQRVLCALLRCGPRSGLAATWAFEGLHSPKNYQSHGKKTTCIMSRAAPTLTRTVE